MPNTYTELLKTTVGTATSSVTLSSIPSGYTDLIIVFSGTVAAGAGGRIQFNGDTASNYSHTILYGNGTSAASFRESNLTSGRFTYEGSIGNTDATRNASIIQIMNYSNATTYKTWLSRANRPSVGLDAIVGLWRSTAAITSITLSVISDTYSVGCTFSLYGIANADLGAAKATGGIITEDANYWYHTFAASGTFTPKVALSCDYLVVAGGGGGGSQSAPGGGGGGGLRSTVTATGGGGSLESAISVLSGTPYAITVGAGGTAGAISPGGDGSNSIFSTITSTGGGGGGGTGAANGRSGGSGGGGAAANPASTGGARTTNQGFAGGTGFTDTTTTSRGGGGGGAGAIGTNGTVTGGAGSGVNGNGGNGVATSISGSSVTYAGGGGGSSNGYGGGTGGTGGGTAGNGAGTATAATANTGGGAGASTNATGAAGGSGIVIIRYAK
jgi:hypothetical protein